MKKINEVLVSLRILRADEGGRSTPIVSGYRPSFHFNDYQTDGAIILRGCEMVTPCGQCEATVKFWNSERLEKLLVPNACFEIREGTKLIGSGKIS